MPPPPPISLSKLGEPYPDPKPGIIIPRPLFIPNPSSPPPPNIEEPNHKRPDNTFNNPPLPKLDAPYPDPDPKPGIIIPRPLFIPNPPSPPPPPPYIDPKLDP